MFYVSGFNRSKNNLPALPFPEKNLDGSFIKSQSLSEGIDQVTVIGEMDFLGIIGDNGKGGRLAGNLGCVKEFYASASVQCRGMRGHSIPQ